MSIHDNLTRLISIAPPPDHPVESGSPDSWGNIESALRLNLPFDYKWIINKYGSGDFADLLSLINPFSNDLLGNLLCQVSLDIAKSFDFLCTDVPLLDHYREGRGGLIPEQCPFLAYPEPGGLLPLARDSNGNDLFWLTSGSSEFWTIVHYDWRGGWLYQQYQMPLSNFLVEWLSGQLPGSFFGVGNDPAIFRHEPVFRANVVSG